MTYPLPGANPDPNAVVPPVTPVVVPPVTVAPPINPPAPSDPAGGDPLDEPLREPGLRALQNERNAREAAERKQRELQQQIDAFAQRDMTELQRAQTQLAQANEQLERTTRENLRNSIALEFEISSDDLVLLTGSTDAEIRAQATRIKTISANPTTGIPQFAPNPGQAAGNGNPAPPNTATVDAGRSLYKQQRTSKSN